MAILNYTTTIDAFKTVSEIEYILVKHEAKSIQKDYENDRIVSLSFVVYNGRALMPIRMPAKVEQCYQALKKEKSKNPRSRIIVTMEQAEKVSWRILKDWVEAQMALLDIEMAKLEEIFMPYIVDRSGQTLFEKLERQQFYLEG